MTTRGQKVARGVRLFQTSKESIYSLVLYMNQLCEYFFFSQAIAIMEVAHGKDHPYISEIKKELEDHWAFESMQSFKPLFKKPCYGNL